MTSGKLYAKDLTRGNASGRIMGRHSLYQRLHRVHSNGSADLQPGGLAVSALLLQTATRKLTGLV